MGMGIGVLGPLEVDGALSPLGLRDRIVLECLAVRPGLPVSADALADAVWGQSPPASWHKVVQGCVVRLRKAIGSDAIETSSQGYRLVVHVDHVDHLRFEHLLGRARELTAAGEPDRAAYLLREALALWRGEPFAELADWAPGRIAGERLRELRQDAEDLLIESELRVGHHREVLAPAQRLVREQPLRERRWALLALAQYQGGRQADALQTVHRARRVLVDELGLDPGQQLADLERAILNQDPSLAIAAAIHEANPQCPYLGLVTYDIADAAMFYGREAVTAACLQRLDKVGVLAVVGPSGCGKSSLIRAGVAAALERDGRTVHVVTPSSRLVGQVSRVPRKAGVVLVIDQCEEALVGEASAARLEFFRSVVEFAQLGPVVLSLRADHLGELSAYPAFARLVERGLYLLGPMDEEELRLAIEGPAAQAGLRLEPGLLDLLVREAAGEPAALPLLSHVLQQTWRHREGGTLTVQGYAATGGIREAVAQSAEGLFRELDADHQSMLRDLMLRLVAPDEGRGPTRTRVPTRSLTADEERRHLVEQLLGARLLTSDGDTVEIAHESLALAWPRLRSWLDEDVDGLRTLRHLSVSAVSWEELGRPDSELYRGARQARAAEWRARAQPSLTAVEDEFLDASAALAASEQRATEEQVRRERSSNQRLRAGLAAVAVLLAVAMVAGALAKTSADRADSQARSADARRLGAEALRAADLDESMLLAAAGQRLMDSVDTRGNLLASLQRAPQLITASRGHVIFTLTVNNLTGQIATAADGGGLQLHDPTTLVELPAPRVPVGPRVAASPDGRHFAYGVHQELTGTADAQPAVLLLDPNGSRSSTQLGGLPLGRYAGADLGFSPNSRWLAASLRDVAGERPDELEVWDLQHPANVMATVDLGDQSHSPVVSADGHTLYSVGSGALEVTTLPGGAVRRLVHASDLGVRDLVDTLALSPDGRILALAAGSEVVLVDTTSLRPRAYLHAAGDAGTVIFSRDGHHVASAGEHLLVWDVSGAEPQVLLDQATSAERIAFSSDGRTLYSTGGPGALLSWDLEGNRSFLHTRFAPLTSGDAVVERFSPDGRKVAYVFTRPPTLQVRDVASGALGPRIPVNQPERNYIDVAWSPDSRVLNATTGDSRVATWDAATGRLLAEHRIDTDGAQPDHATGVVEGASIAFFSHDGKYLLVGSTTGRLHVLDSRTLSSVRPPVAVPHTAGSTEPVAIARLEPSPDNHTALVRSLDQVDYLTGRVGPRLSQLPQDAGLYYSPDGRRLFVTATHGAVGLVDARSMTWISPLTDTEPFPAYLVAFSPDGTQVAAIAGGRVGRWDGHTGAFLGAVSVPEDGAVQFSRDGKELRIAAGGGAVLTWDLRPTSWVDAACRMAGRDLTTSEWRTYLPDRPFEPVCRS